MFGIYYCNKNIQWNYVYEETVAGKGTDEVNSMLRHFIDRVVIAGGYWKLTIYADNCGGQNKNSFVVRMLLALTHASELEEVSLKFFVKGHTKNAVDRGFGHVRKHVSRMDLWTMDQLLEAVNEASLSSALVHIPKASSVFKEYRDVLEYYWMNIIHPIIFNTIFHASKPISFEYFQSEPPYLKLANQSVESSSFNVRRYSVQPSVLPVPTSVSRTFNAPTHTTFGVVNCSAGFQVTQGGQPLKVCGHFRSKLVYLELRKRMDASTLEMLMFLM
ncbi:hypothetical protein PHMEG_00039094 [Phytophthora megakarya]|uniref:DUF7869 domain-containing protein n=1 Tax=Phytophthora megakarya TaxID=4795 RepID=A0A225UG43_9STRA|nr:hypothetical protein PHMEG_00039094 [Phytophthora megakarya]